MKSGWSVFFRERIPLPVYLLLCGGFTVGGLYLGRIQRDALYSEKLDAVAIALGFLGILLFFICLRVMDEVKDYRKDVVAHPERPLPRGVLTVEEVRGKIGFIYALLWVLAFALGVRNVPAGLSLACTNLWLWLMYKEFYVGESLARSPLLYACTHQIILLPVCSTAVAAAHPELGLSMPNFWYGLTVLGAFFGYEVGRKLDPHAHPALDTYLVRYGRGHTSFLLVALAVLASYGAHRAGTLSITVWGAAFLLALLPVLFVKPSRYKLVELAATFSLLIHIYSPALKAFFASFGGAA